MNISFSDIKSLFLENKTLKQTILKNGFWLVIAEIFEKGVVFFCTLGIARHFGPTIYGQWAFAISFVVIFVIFSEMGFFTLTVREIAQDKSKTAEYIDNILLMKSFLAIGTFAAIVFLSQFLGKDWETLKLVYFLGAYILINTFSTFLRSIFQANEKMQYEAISRIVQNSVLILLVYFFILEKKSIVVISYAYIGASLVGITLSSILVWHFFSRFFKKVSIKACRKILSESWQFALTGFIFILYSQVDVLILSFLKSPSSVGLYSVANDLSSNFISIPSMIMTVMYPRLSVVLVESHEKLQILSKEILRYILLLSVVLFPMLFVFASVIISIFYGQSYIGAVGAFRILLLATFFSFLNCVLAYIIFAMKRQIVFTKIVAVTLTLNIVLNLLLAPKFSYIGTSWAVTGGQFFQCVLLCLAVRKYLFKRVASPTIEK